MKPYIKWPCIFGNKLIKEQVNPRLRAIDEKCPYGAFQKAWRTEHCSQLDFYGLGQCPYPPRDCVIAYYQVASKVLREPDVKSRVGLFREVARRYGAERADTKPLARDTIRRTDVPDAGGSVARGDDEGRDVRPARPRSLGDLFRGDDR